MRKYLILLILLIGLLAIPALAEQFTGPDNQTIRGIFNSGSALELTATDGTKLRDIKGYLLGRPFISNDLSMFLYPGLYEGMAGGLVAGIDEGAVVLNIEREGDAPGSPIKVSWKLNSRYAKDDLAATAKRMVVITYAKGDGSGQYPDNAGFTEFMVELDGLNPAQLFVVAGVMNRLEKPIDANGFVKKEKFADVERVPNEKAFRLKDQVGRGINEVYFKGCVYDIMPLGAITYRKDEDTPLGMLGNIAVGKINTELKAGKSDLLTIPMYPTNASGVITSSDLIFGEMMSSGYLLYNSGGLVRLDCRDKKWNASTMLNLSQGFWLLSANDLTLTFVGKIMKYQYEKELAYRSELYGYPLPRTVAAGELGISPLLNDYALVNQGGLVRYTYNGSEWDGDFSVSMGKGFWYYNPVPLSTQARYLSVTY